MTRSPLEYLEREQVVHLDRAQIDKLPFPLKGSVRLVDEKGQTLAMMLDKSIIEEIKEDLEATNPDFLASLDSSRRSGRVSAARIKASGLGQE